MSTVIPGRYQLLIGLKQPARIRVGALGVCQFPAGWYVYTGSARGGLAQRISRHLRADRRLHWHVDYLLAAADHVEAFFLAGLEVSECERIDDPGLECASSWLTAGATTTWHI